MIHFACPGCQKMYKVPDEFAGRQTKCRQCGTALRVPECAPPPLPPAKRTGTEAPNRSVAEQFQRRRSRMLALYPIVLLCLSVLGLFLGASVVGPDGWLRRMLGWWGWEPIIFGTAFLVGMACAVFAFVNWRCPACRNYLGPVLNVPACRKCGAVFHSDSTAAAQAADLEPTRQGKDVWLWVAGSPLAALPLLIVWWWAHHYHLLADLKQRGFSYDPYVAGHYHLPFLDGIGGTLLLIAAGLAAAFFVSKHRHAPRLYIGFLLLGLVFTLARFGLMWSLLGSDIARSRYEFYDFRRGSTVGLLLTSHLLTALIASAIGIPFFVCSTRVRSTFVQNKLLPRRMRNLWLGAFAAPEVIVLIGGILFLGLGSGLFRSSPATKENTSEEPVTAQPKVALTQPVADVPGRPGPNPTPETAEEALVQPAVEVRPGPNPAPEGTLVRPETGRWFGVIQSGEFSPIYVEFEIAEDRRSVQALMLTGPKMSSAWLPGTFFFDEQEIGAGRFAAARGESQVTVTFLSENEARGQAKVTMEILKNPSLEVVKTLVMGDFTVKPRHLWGGVLDGGVNPLLGRWHCLTRTLDTMTLEFKADGTGSAVYKLHGKTFTYFFDPRSRRVDISDAQGNCELTPDGRLAADLRFSFVDVLQPGFPTITVDVNTFFTPRTPTSDETDDR